MLTAKDLDVALHKKPFVPFLVVTNTGKTYAIKGFGDLAIGKSYAMLGVRERDTDQVCDHADRVFYQAMLRLESTSLTAPTI